MEYVTVLVSVLIAGIITVICWKYLLVGSVVMAFYFIGLMGYQVITSIPIQQQVVPVSHQLEILSSATSLAVEASDVSSWFDPEEQNFNQHMMDCLSLTGKKDICSELWEQRQ